VDGAGALVRDLRQRASPASVPDPPEAEDDVVARQLTLSVREPEVVVERELGDEPHAEQPETLFRSERPYPPRPIQARPRGRRQ